jgi:hypothetical protein
MCHGSRIDSPQRASQLRDAKRAAKAQAFRMSGRLRVGFAWAAAAGARIQIARLRRDARRMGGTLPAWEAHTQAGAVRSRPADRNLPLDFTTVPRHPGTHRATSFPKTLTLNIVRTAEIGPSPCCSRYKTRSRVPKTLTSAPAGEVFMRYPGPRGDLPQTLTYRCSAENPQSILVLTMYI